MRAAFRETFETILVALTVFLVLQASIQTFRVEGFSMQPSLQDREYLLVNKLVYLRLPSGLLAPLTGGGADSTDPSFAFHPPERGEIIVFRPPSVEAPDYVKRVIGVPGDVVTMRRGQVFVNGLPMDEQYISKDNFTFDAVRVPPETVFVLGDNRPIAEDSRGFGVVPWENIVGKVWVRFWPSDTLGVMSAP